MKQSIMFLYLFQKRKWLLYDRFGCGRGGALGCYGQRLVAVVSTRGANLRERQTSKSLWLAALEAVGPSRLGLASRYVERVADDAMLEYRWRRR